VNCVAGVAGLLAVDSGYLHDMSWVGEIPETYRDGRRPLSDHPYFGGIAPWLLR